MTKFTLMRPPQRPKATTKAITRPPKLSTVKQRLKKGIPDTTRRDIALLLKGGYSFGELADVFLIDPEQLRIEVEGILSDGN